MHPYESMSYEWPHTSRKKSKHGWYQLLHTNKSSLFALENTMIFQPKCSLDRQHYFYFLLLLCLSLFLSDLQPKHITSIVYFNLSLALSSVPWTSSVHRPSLRGGLLHCRETLGLCGHPVGSEPSNVSQVNRKFLSVQLSVTCHLLLCAHSVLVKSLPMIVIITISEWHVSLLINSGLNFSLFWWSLDVNFLLFGSVCAGSCGNVFITLSQSERKANCQGPLETLTLILLLSAHIITGVSFSLFALHIYTFSNLLNSNE